jgi:hypothetical protein
MENEFDVDKVAEDVVKDAEAFGGRKGLLAPRRIEGPVCLLEAVKMPEKIRDDDDPGLIVNKGIKDGI